MTDPVQEPDAARKRERLAGALKQHFRSTIEAAAGAPFETLGVRCDDAVFNGYADAGLAALRASEPVPGAVGVSVEDIDRTLRGLGAIDLANYQHRRVVANALLILVTPRTVEPDPASGAIDLRSALVLAANRLDSCVLDYHYGSRRRYEVSEWADEARAAARPSSPNTPIRGAGSLCGSVADRADGDSERAATLVKLSSSPRDAGEAETAEQLRRERDAVGGVLLINGFAWRIGSEADYVGRAIDALKARVADLERQIAGAGAATTFPTGTRVRKTKGSSWQGHVVGHYSTSLTPDGVCVESEREPGSVQIYPATALVRVEDQETSRGE